MPYGSANPEGIVPFPLVSGTFEQWLYLYVFKFLLLWPFKFHTPKLGFFYLFIHHFILNSNADATCNFYPCESVIFVQFPCAIKENGKSITNDAGDRWSRGCPMDDEFSGFYVIDGVKSRQNEQFLNIYEQFHCNLTFHKSYINTLRISFTFSRRNWIS